MTAGGLTITVSPTLADFRTFGRERFLGSGGIQRLAIFSVLALIAFLFATDRLASAAAFSAAFLLGFAYVAYAYAWLWSFPQTLWYGQEHLAPLCYEFSENDIAIAAEGFTSRTAYGVFYGFVVLPSAVAIRRRGQDFSLITRREAGEQFEPLLALLRTKLPEARSFESKPARPPVTETPQT